jgi:thiol-disulfide isomerase/thioredoxin
MKKYFFLILTTILFFHNISYCQEGLDRGFKVKVGDLSPEFSLELLDGSILNNKKLLDKVVVLQFTASWCGVCIKEMPHLEEKVWQVFKSDDFILIGIDLKEELDIVQNFVSKVGVTYPIAIDKDGSVFESFTTEKAGVTRNIVLNKRGEIIFLTRLFDELEFSQMVEVVKAELLKYE